MLNHASPYRDSANVTQSCVILGTSRMSTLLEDAVQVLRQLPEEVQEAAARTIIEYAASYGQEL